MRQSVLAAQSSKISNTVKRRQFDCDACRYQFSVTAGTIFNDSTCLSGSGSLLSTCLCESRKGMSANQIKRTLGISYNAAWYLCHRIRAAIKEVTSEPLSGTVEMDETYVGGKNFGMGVWYGKHSKEIVFGVKQRGGELLFFDAADVKSGTWRSTSRECLSACACDYDG
jgi:transposase-like protein